MLQACPWVMEGVLQVGGGGGGGGGKHTARLSAVVGRLLGRQLLTPAEFPFVTPICNLNTM